MANQISAQQLEACVAVLREQQTPISLTEIAKKAWGAKTLSVKRRGQLLSALDEVSAEKGIHRWPKFRGSPRFCSQRLRVAVEIALLKALDARPLSATTAAGLVQKAVGLSKTEALNEVKTVAAGLVPVNRIYTIPVNSKAFVYASAAWLEGLLPSSPSATQPRTNSHQAILRVIERIQPGHGNYVRVDRLRAAPEVRRTLDDAVLELASAGKLVLARYDGPRLNMPDQEKINYIEDDRGELFIGVAFRREESAN